MDLHKDFLHKILHLIKNYKRYSLLIIIVLWIIIYSFSGSSTSEVKVQKSYTVATWSIKNSIKVLWDTKITNQQTLTFGYEWSVKALYVKEGDVVKKWQLLAEIDKWDLQKNIAQQSLSVQSSRVSYQKALTQYSAADKLKAQQNIDDTQLKLNIAKKELADMVANQWDSLQTNSSDVQSFLLSTKNMILDVKNISDSIDKIFGFTDKWKYINEDIIIYISAKDNSSKNNAEMYFNQASSKLSIVESTLNTLENSSIVTIDALQNLQDKNRDFLNNFSTMLSYALSAAKNSIITTDLTQSDIDSRSSTINSASSKTISYLSSVNNDVQSIKTTENDVKNKQNEIKNYESQLASYKETLQDMQEWLSREDKILQENSIKQWQISLSKLQEQTENYELRAPFDGNIDMITFKVGDNISNDNISTEWITISNPNFYEIDMLIDQVDIVKVQKWQLANITFDAYPWYTVTGTISNIDPTPVENAGVVSYTAIIAMQKWEKKIYDSMTTNIEILTDHKDNIIVVPTTAIQTKWINSFVQVTENWFSSIRPVQIWINDTFNTEITSWLNLWEIVLLNEYETTSSSESTTTSEKSWESARDSMRWLGVGWGMWAWFPRD